MSLPAIPRVSTGNPALDRLLDALKESVEVRAGVRGDPLDRAVTLRDLKALGVDVAPVMAVRPSGTPNGAQSRPPRPVGAAAAPVDGWVSAVLQSRVFKDLMERIEGVERFSMAPEEVRTILAASLADEARARGASISSLEKTVQGAMSSLAYKLETVTASLGRVAAGIRSTQFAFADANRAMASRVDQVQASLGDGLAAVEETLTAVADATQGLEAQYTLKVQAGNKIAGFGLAATSPTGGYATSAAIFLADKFAVVLPSDTIPDPMNPPVSRMPFAVDAQGVHVRGSLLAEVEAGVTDGAKVSGYVVSAAVLGYNLETAGIGVTTWKGGVVAYAKLGNTNNAGAVGGAGVADANGMSGKAAIGLYGEGKGALNPEDNIGVWSKGDLVVESPPGMAMRFSYGNTVMGLSAKYLNGREDTYFAPASELDSRLKYEGFAPVNLGTAFDGYLTVSANGSTVKIPFYT